MSVSALSAVIRRVGADPGETDAVLLEQFNSTGDQAAFAELVRRYARLVWALCRHSLLCDADADDAFQATFLTLARHASSVRDPNRLGPWLHTVAVRVCKNARRASARRAKREVGAAVPEHSRPVADSAWDAATATVHEEVAKLPTTHRAAFVLCVLEGKTPTAAAAQLGLPVGTVGSHLHRAKERLLKQLTARGFGAAVAFATLLDTPPASAVERAVTVTRAPHAAVLSLLNGAAPMTLPHAKLLLVLAVLAAGLIGLLLPTAAQDPPKAAPPKVEKPAAKLDLHGDPLPEKAVMRLGTVKYRVPGIAGVGFKKTGELVVLTDRLELHTFPVDNSPMAAVTPLRDTPTKYGLWRVAISADARFAAAHVGGNGKEVGKLVVWDISGVKPVEHLTREMKDTYTLAFSPDGRWLAVNDPERETPEPLLLLDVAKQKWRSLPMPPGVHIDHLGFTPDGSRLDVTDGSTARVFDTATGELLLNAKFDRERLNAAALSPDGKTVLVLPGTWLYGSEKDVRILSVADGGDVRGLTLPKAISHTCGFSADGKMVWVAGEGRIREWDPSAAKWLREAVVPTEHRKPPVWAPDGKRFAGYNGHTVALVDAKTWKPLHPDPLAAGPTEAIFGITISLDGKTIATDGDTVHLWDAATGKLLGSVKATWGNQPMLAFLPDSKSFITIANNQYPIECDARTGKELRRFKLPDDLVKKVTLRDLRLSADGKTLETFASSASSQWKSVRLRWDVAKGEVSGRAEVDERERFDEDMFGGRSPDGEWRAANGSVSRTDGSVKPSEVFPPFEQAFSGASWSPNSGRVALARGVGKAFEDRQKDENNSVVVFDVTKNEKVVELQTGKVARSAFTADGKFLATMAKEKLTVWDLSTGKEVYSAACDSGNTIIQRGLVFTTDGKRLITTHGTHCLVWDVSTATR